jgi:hypothetical protein
MQVPFFVSIFLAVTAMQFRGCLATGRFPILEYGAIHSPAPSPLRMNDQGGASISSMIRALSWILMP